MPRPWFAVAYSAFDPDHPVLRGDPARIGAWLGVIAMTAFEPKTVQTACGSVALERGQVLLSVRFLQQRWGWSRGAVHRFLTDLVSAEMLGTLNGTPSGTPTGTVYVVRNYDVYQFGGEESGTPSGTARGTKRTILQDNKKKKKADPADKAAADSMNRDAQELVKRVVEAGLRGHTPPQYGRQIGRAKQLLKDKPLAYWLEAAEAMGRLFPHNRNPWDVFNLGTDGGRAVAMMRERKPVVTPAKKLEQLRGALAAVLRQQPDFRGGIPDANRTGVRIDPADFAAWDQVLEDAGLRRRDAA